MYEPNFVPVGNLDLTWSQMQIRRSFRQCCLLPLFGTRLNGPLCGAGRPTANFRPFAETEAK